MLLKIQESRIEDRGSRTAIFDPRFSILDLLQILVPKLPFGNEVPPVATVALLLSWLGVGYLPVKAADQLEYNRNVRPILAENCFACHGPDSAARKAKLRLDIRDEAVKAGAIAPGQPDKSALIERIFAEDVEERMPPAKARKTLTTTQKELLKRWIAE